MTRSFFKIFLLTLLTFKNIYGQSDTLQLSELTVRGLETQKSIINTPAAVSVMNLKFINRYENSTLLPVFNSQPGVRLEERSPGSYRIALRGSSLRSPFGVRNVKLYWNGIPMTDAGGLSYFNQLDMNALGRIEILKGPSSSLYGAGIGGVINFSTRNAPQGREASVGVLAGSFGLLNSTYSYSHGSEKNNLFINLNTNQFEGYRDHSSLNKLSFNLSNTYFGKNGRIFNIVSFISNLGYDTPGGLTFAQYQENPEASRPAAGPNLSSKEQNAGIYQNIGFLGVSEEMQYKNGWKSSSSFFISRNALQNPFINNYEERREFTWGGRIQAQKTWENIPLRFWAGVETLDTYSNFDVYDNNKGTKTNQRYKDKVNAENGSFFAQAEYSLPFDWQLMAGLSLNRQAYNFRRTPTQSAFVAINEKGNPAVPLTPRFSVLKSFSNKLSLFGALGSGYSAPTASEMVATASFGNLNSTLQAEKAFNYEIGFKYASDNNFLDISFFKQNIRNALVRNLNDAGNEFFLNTGRLLQQGVESIVKRNWMKNKSGVLNALETSLSYTFNDFKYNQYSVLGTELSGNQLPGSPKHNVYVLGTVSSNYGFDFFFDVNYLSQIPLNDANTFYSEDAWIAQSRLTYSLDVNKVRLIGFMSVNNLFNEKYSAGYDFNAFGNRFYNAAPPRHFNFGVKATFKF